MRSRNLTPAALAAALYLSVTADPAQAQQPGKLTLLPARVQAGQAFDLMLAGSGYNCAVSYDHVTASVNKGTVYLNYHAEENPGVRCGTKTRPMGPEFKVPALEAGSYPVIAVNLTDCMILPSPCAMIPPMYHAGILTVSAAPASDTGWSMRPRQVRPDSAGEIFLFHPKLNSCNSVFQYNTLKKGPDARSGVEIIGLSFETQNNKRLCSLSVAPFGPLFPLPALPAGKYPVRAYDLPACAFDAPPCIPIRPWDPVFVDTLTVGTVAPDPVGPMPRAADRVRMGRLRWTPEAMVLAFEGGLDTYPSWLRTLMHYAVLLGADGQSWPVTAHESPDGTLTYRLPRDLPPGAYRLAWASPRGGRESLPFVHLP